MSDRNETIARIRKALKKRSGKPWSVTGGRGTAWGWLKIDAPPKMRTAHFTRDPDALDSPENYYEVEMPDEPNGCTPLALRNELNELLGLGSEQGRQGVSIPSCGKYYAEYIDRAEGRTPAVYGEQYWD